MESSGLAVAIIVPCRNVSTTIAKTMKALMEQDFALPYRVIAVNDGSSDNTFAILKTFENHYPDKLIVISQDAGNLCVARNAAMPLALEAEYVGFSDGDDVPHHDFISSLYGLAKRTGADCACMNYRIVKDGIAKDNDQFFSGEREMSGLRAAYEIIKDRKCKAYVWNKLFRSEMLTRTGIEFLVDRTYYEDTVFSFQSFLRSNKVAFQDKPVYDYLIRSGSLSHTPDPDAFIMHINAYAACREYVEYYYGVRIAKRMFHKTRFTMKTKVWADIMTAHTVYPISLKEMSNLANSLLGDLRKDRMPVTNRPWKKLVERLPLWELPKLSPISSDFGTLANKGLGLESVGAALWKNA